MKMYLWVALGGALGSVARHGVGEWVTARWGAAFPWGTLLVNVVGAALIGALMPTLQGGARGFLVVGVLGGFTTFSAFSWQTLALARDGQWSHAAVYVALSLGLCFAAVWAGAKVAESLR